MVALVNERLVPGSQVMSDTQPTELLAGQPDEIRDEILSINDEARDRALQVAVGRAGSGQPHWARQLLRDDATPGPDGGGPGRRDGLGLTYCTQEAPAQVAKASSRVARSVSVLAGGSLVVAASPSRFVFSAGSLTRS
jgi:hypothetical protein